MNKNNSNIGQVEEYSESNISTQYKYGCYAHVTAKRNEEYYATSKVYVSEYTYRDAPNVIKKTIDRLKRELTYESNKSDQEVEINYLSYYEHETWGKRRQVIDVKITNSKKIDYEAQHSGRYVIVYSDTIDTIVKSAPKGYKLSSVTTSHRVHNHENWKNEKIYSDEIETKISLVKETRGKK